MVVMVYHVAANSKLANTPASLLGEIQGWLPLSLWWQHFCQWIDLVYYVLKSLNLALIIKICKFIIDAIN